MEELSSPLIQGFYPDIPAAVYHTLDYASRSYLAMLAQGKTLAHVHYEMVHPTPSTPTQILGQAVHAAILEPDLFPVQFIRCLDRPKRSKVDKEAWAEYQAAHPDAAILSNDQMDQIEAITERVLYHTSARMILEMEGNTVEGTGIWDQSLPEDKAVRCKIRPDLYVPSLEAVVDLKTTEDASVDAFQRSIDRYGYHYQAGFYVHGMQMLGLPVKHFIVIAVEKTPPYLCAVYRMTQEVIEAGWDELAIPLQQMAQAYVSDRWDGYSEQIEDVALPPWKMRSLYS